MTIHKAIYGSTLSGKSTLARALVAAARNDNIVPIIYDPTESKLWSSDYVTSDSAEFFYMLKQAHEQNFKIFAVVDEADTLLSVSEKENHWLASRGRHFGLELCVITQRPQMIAPTVRGQTGEQFLFNIGVNDAKFLANDHGAQGFEDAPELVKGEFLHCRWEGNEKRVDKFKIF